MKYTEVEVKRAKTGNKTVMFIHDVCSESNEKSLVCSVVFNKTFDYTDSEKRIFHDIADMICTLMH